MFANAASNDVMLYHNQSNAGILFGISSNTIRLSSNATVFTGSNVTFSNNINVSGIATVSNLTITGSVKGFNGITSNQSFSNIWASNGTFSNLTIGSISSPMLIVGGYTRATLSPPNVIAQITGSNVTCSNMTASNMVGSNMTASNGTFSEIYGSNIVSFGPVTCSNIYNRGWLYIYN
jgi:hypothetical protein